MRRCPALLIGAPASGQGKTLVTAALARHYRDQGLRVRAFKVGPDFLDPMILERASGAPVYQLDLWMGGEDHCRTLLHEAAGAADLILIEGAMGLFDGDPSGADLALAFGIPVLAVIDASAMAGTFGAVALGLARYRSDLPMAGVLANRVAGERHYGMLAESLPPELKAVGWLERRGDIALPERHLGLVQAAEIDDLDTRIGQAAAALRIGSDALPPPVPFAPPPAPPDHPPLLQGVRIAVARDAAFSFLYRANLDTLRALGAGITFFSPLVDPAPPPADALYLPGGYPELHLGTLGANRALHGAIADHHARGRPTLAECGGLLYLLGSLTDAAGRRGKMAEVLPGRGLMERNLVNLGLHAVNLPEGELRGHTFHHSRCDAGLEPIACSRASRHHGRPEAVFRTGRLTASYLHLYFPSNPEAVGRLFAP